MKTSLYETMHKVHKVFRPTEIYLHIHISQKARTYIYVWKIDSQAVTRSIFSQHITQKLWQCVTSSCSDLVS